MIFQKYFIEGTGVYKIIKNDQNIFENEKKILCTSIKISSTQTPTFGYIARTNIMCT